MGPAHAPDRDAGPPDDPARGAPRSPCPRRRGRVVSALIGVTVCGIPAAVRITSYTPGDPAGGPEVDWEICDRRGGPAPWLARKVGPMERARIERKIMEEVSRCAG